MDLDYLAKEQQKDGALNKVKKHNVIAPWATSDSLQYPESTLWFKHEKYKALHQKLDPDMY